jgi:hypothetical protein
MLLNVAGSKDKLAKEFCLENGFQKHIDHGFSYSCLKKEGNRITKKITFYDNKFYFWEEGK